MTTLPDTISTFLTAHAADDVEATLVTLAPDAVVTDQGSTFRGTDEIDRFLRTAASEYTYTTELTGSERVDDDHWVARIRIEGNFPGGVADLAYRFTLADGLITELRIG
ncbi:nuclear transport factor 2 family protein [Aeromicrobium fastidiosum]|uniref:Nuclear transport factor 2 family protein n=1 Tax=Aeromicrobium fastidiosum TaxID=52699 RepID=A0A641AKH8_9ACTN|nr:nuclear transport factor 2 family protein [Aeromicrobium fastidiosum]KAA1376337.1 nuclear transport factor 2 family protein [Aeromicrobium fastidiosum]MBP2391763.1 ketosteroid isomerase-like protein [Aeromicrobium fastidiosum]